MAGGRFREAMSDMAETLRRLFKDPPSHALDPAISGPSTGGTPMLETAPLAGDLAFSPPVGEVPELAPAPVVVSYLGSVFTISLLACKECGQTLVPEELALGRMAEVEQLLEDK